MTVMGDLSFEMLQCSHMSYLCFVVTSICSRGAYLRSNGKMEAAESSIAPSQTRGAPFPLPSILPLFLPGQLLAHAVSQSESVTACVGSFSAEREGEGGRERVVLHRRHMDRFY